MALQIDFIWLVSVSVCAWMGHRLAKRTGVNPKAGLILGVAVNVFMAMDLAPPVLYLGKTVLEIELLSVYFAVLACLWFLLLTGSKKGVALFTIGGAVAVLAFAFSLLPRDLLPGSLSEPFVFETETVARQSGPNLNPLAEARVLTPPSAGLFSDATSPRRGRRQPQSGR